MGRHLTSILFIVFFACAFVSEANAGSRFWVGGNTSNSNTCNGNWGDTNCWSSSTGGAEGASAPGTNDDATFDGANGSTMNATTASSGGTVTDRTVNSLVMNGSYTGTLDFQATIFTCKSTMTLTAGTADADSATMVFTGGSATLDVNSTQTFQHFTINKTSGSSALTIANSDTITVTGTTTFTKGNLNGGNSSSVLNAEGNVYFDDLVTGFPNGKIVATGSNNVTWDGNQSEAGGGTTPVIQINKTGGTLTFGDGSGTDSIRVSRNFTWTAGTVAHSAGATIIFRNMTINAPAANMSFNNVVIDDGTATMASAIDINGDLTIANDAGAKLETGFPTCYNITLAGDFTQLNGDLAERTCTVTLDGANQTITGNITFYKLIKTVSSADTLTIGTGNTLYASNTLTLQGASGSYLALRSSVTGATNEFKTRKGTTVTTDYLDIKDGDVVDSSGNLGPTISPTNCYLSGNTNGWNCNPYVRFSASSQSAAESVGTVTVTAELPEAPSSDVTIPFTVSGTATAGGTDHNLANGNITILSADAKSTGTATFTATADTIDETDETVILTMGTPTNAVAISPSVHTVTITDDDSAPTMSINDASATEGSALTFRVSLSNASASTITVNYATADNTATVADSDYTAVSSTQLSFSTGETTKDIAITSTSDSTFESDETFYVNLSGVSSGASISDSQGVGTITNDDTAPSSGGGSGGSGGNSGGSGGSTPTPVTASAGSDRRMNAGESITLSGSGTGSNLTYSWIIVSGNSDGVISLSSASSSQSIFSVSQNTSSRQVTVRLTVTDGTTSASDDAVVTVNRYLEAASIQTETQSNIMVVGSVGGYTVYEHRTEQNGNEIRSLVIGLLTLQLPSGYSNYTIDETSTGRMMIGLQFPSGRSQVFLATESTGILANISRTVDLSELADLAVSASVSKASTFDSNLVPEVLTSSSSDPFLILERNENDGFASYLGTGDINADGAVDIAIVAPGCGFNGCIYIYNNNYVLTGIIFGSSSNAIYSLTVQNLFSQSKNAFLLGPHNPGIKKNLQVGSTLTVTVAVSKSFALNAASGLTGEVQLSSTGVDASLSPDATIQTTAVGDYNADGNQDVALATTNGTVYIINGPLVEDTVYSENDAAVVIRNGSLSDGFGQSLAFRDVTGDGHIDLLIGAPAHNSDTGILYVIPGGTTWSSSMNVNTESGVIQVSCEASGDHCFAGIFLRDTDSNGVVEIFTSKSTNSVYKVDLYGSITTNPGDEFSFESGGCSITRGTASRQMLLMFLMLLVTIRLQRMCIRRKVRAAVRE